MSTELQEQPSDQPSVEALSSLTVKQRIFVCHYLGEAKGNATEAARMAGYSNAEYGRQVLRNLTVQAAIAAKLDKEAISCSHVLAHLSAVAQADIGEFLTGDDNNQLEFDFASAKAAGKTHLIKSFRKTKDGWSLELHDSLAALKLLAQYHRLLVDRVELTGPNNTPLFDAFNQALEKAYGDPVTEVESTS